MNGESRQGRYLLRRFCEVAEFAEEFLNASELSKPYEVKAKRLPAVHLYLPIYLPLDCTM